ncbi:MAG: HD domain-containing protein [Planctomycetes bacterium]|nr:HD domain-containing protein [Planctomycetota bacterium]
MPRRVYIIDMAPNQLIEGVFTMQNCQLGLTKNGKPYLKCLLQDRSGRTPGRMWSVTEDFVQSLPTDGFVFIEGQTQAFQGELQIIVQHLRVVEPKPEELLDLLPSTTKDVDEMFAHVGRLIDSMKSEALKALARTYLNDKPLMERFRQAPAAMQLHHAYLGGLLEHTLALMKLADAVMPLYPKLNRDIVMMGLFLHDLGKCDELTWQTGFAYSDDGQLVGHIARGLVWLNDKVAATRAAGVELSPELVRVLEHIILSHHGVPEFGALKIPATPEAIMVSLLDNVDAKTQMAIDAGRGPASRSEELGGAFTEKVWALGTRIYRPDPLGDVTDAPGASASPTPPQKSPAKKPFDGPPLKGGI